MFSDRSIMWSWESRPGIIEFDSSKALSTWSLKAGSNMFDPKDAAIYSAPIQIEQQWLDALSPPMPEASSPGNNLVMNSFEALLNQSGLPKASQGSTRFDTLNVEYVTTLFFLNGLSRVGLSLQLEHDNPASDSLRPEFNPYDITNDTFIGGAEQYPERNHTEPHAKAHYQ